MLLTPSEKHAFDDGAFILRSQKMMLDTALPDRGQLNGEFERLQESFFCGVEVFRDAMEATLRKYDGAVRFEEFDEKFGDILAVQPDAATA
ncbi:MAG: hypothetical protein PHU04_00300 [Candidatus Peribacteraceae bacterium]|nr:hypothetical protein [Candidatus Peribacteraceae bacterium]